eukprot:CAMPEP_0178377338 /NCGR_PEP_ID=MMETSP0689_2-20121128/3867_1 /TAXON_ID=160604 /ORGANISM="Amphidinium massartii, Strain CS-259" /LENGTH=117 /DNA_ID=CAMNT_0019997389 /DNA_START=160 /DNA_END=510 /DNA_ORIENTATION=-
MNFNESAYSLASLYIVDFMRVRIVTQQWYPVIHPICGCLTVINDYATNAALLQQLHVHQVNYAPHLTVQNHDLLPSHHRINLTHAPQVQPHLVAPAIRHPMVPPPTSNAALVLVDVW